jgi:hypothetical protein
LLYSAQSFNDWQGGFTHRKCKLQLLAHHPVHRCVR